MRLKCIVAADASVELFTANMLDGDDVEVRMPMRALCEWRD
jgi:hypothetical protein